MVAIGAPRAGVRKRASGPVVIAFPSGVLRTREVPEIEEGEEDRGEECVCGCFFGER